MDNVTANVDYTYRPSSTAQNFTSLISNEEIQNMYYSSDSVTQLRAAFLFSLRQNEVSLFYIVLRLIISLTKLFSS